MFYRVDWKRHGLTVYFCTHENAGGLSKILKTFGNFWELLGGSRRLRGVLETSRKFREPPGSSRKIRIVQGAFRTFKKAPGSPVRNLQGTCEKFKNSFHFREAETTSEKFSCLQENSENFRLILQKVSRTFGDIQESFEKFRKYSVGS